MSTPGWIRGLRSLLVLAVLAGFVAILVRRDGPTQAPAWAPRGPRSPQSPLSPPPGTDRGGPPPPATESASLSGEDDVPADAILGIPLALRLVERNEDEFQEDLGSEEGADTPAAVVHSGGTAWLHPDVARATDAATLGRFGVHLADPSVPLARCSVILVHHIVYAGRGREGARVEVHGLPSLPASVALEAPALGGSLTFDPATEHAPFAAAAQRLRVLPEGGRLELSSRGADGVRVTFSGRSQDVASGARATLSSLSRRITVTEKALGLDAVELGLVRRDSVPDGIFPEVRHGEVEFRTELSLEVLGRIRAVGLEGPGGGDLR